MIWIKSFEGDLDPKHKCLPVARFGQYGWKRGATNFVLREAWGKEGAAFERMWSGLLRRTLVGA